MHSMFETRQTFTICEPHTTASNGTGTTDAQVETPKWENLMMFIMDWLASA